MFFIWFSSDSEKATRGRGIYWSVRTFIKMLASITAFFGRKRKIEIVHFSVAVSVWTTCYYIDWCYARRQTCSVMPSIYYYHTSITVFLTFVHSVDDDLFYLNISSPSLNMPPLWLRSSFQPPLLRESETERWWSGCGGGGLTREEGMTAAIIKNVLLRCYLEASPPLHPHSSSNNSLVTPFHRQTPRLLMRPGHSQKARKDSQQFN